MPQLTVTGKRLRIGVRYTSVFFPFDGTLFLEAVEKLGYTLTGDLTDLVPGRRISVDGIIARKGPLAIRLHTDRNTIVVQGPGVNDILDEVDSIESRLKDDLGFDRSGLLDFYEFTAYFLIRSEKSPLESWYAHLAATEIMQSISKVFDGEVYPFGLRLGLKDLDPNQGQWLDVNILPAFTPAGDQYLVDVVFRDAARDKVFDFARNAQNSVLALLSKVEEV